MRRWILLGMIALLVNFPVVHAAVLDHIIGTSGIEVNAPVVRALAQSGGFFVDYRLPKRIDSRGIIYGGRVDAATYGVARRTHLVAVRVVPGHPSENRPDGAVSSPLFWQIAVAADLVLLVAAALVWRRGRRQGRVIVEEVGQGLAPDHGPDELPRGDLVRVTLDGESLTCSAPETWVSRAVVGARVAGRVYLLAASDLAVTLPEASFEHEEASRYVARGRVVENRRGRVLLDLDGSRAGARILMVKPGRFRADVDVREYAEAVGTMVFRPYR